MGLQRKQMAKYDRERFRSSLPCLFDRVKLTRALTYMGVSMCLSEPITFAFSILGITLSCCYIFSRLLPYDKYARKCDEKLKKSIEDWLKKENEDQELADRKKLTILLCDYKSTNEEISRRENITLLIGSILITSSFLLLGNVANPTISSL